MNDSEVNLMQYLEKSLESIYYSLITSDNTKYNARKYYAEIRTELLNGKEINSFYQKGSYIDQQLSLIKIKELLYRFYTKKKVVKLKGQLSKRNVKDIINQYLHEIKFFNYQEIVAESNFVKQKFEAYDIISELNIYVNKLIKAQRKGKKKSIADIREKDFFQYYRHSWRNKLNNYLISEGKRKYYCINTSNSSLKEADQISNKMDNIIKNKCFNLILDYEQLIKSAISDQKYEYYDDIFIGKNGSKAIGEIKDEDLEPLLKRRIYYKYEIVGDKKEQLENDLTIIKGIRNELFHYKLSKNVLKIKNVEDKTKENYNFYQENIVSILEEKYLSTNILKYISKEAMKDLIDKSYENILYDNNYRHMSVNKLFENKIRNLFNYNGKEENEELHHVRKNLTRIVYKNIFLPQLENETLYKEFRIILTPKIKEYQELIAKINCENDFVSELQKIMTVFNRENKFAEEKELALLIRVVYTNCFVNFLKTKPQFTSLDKQIELDFMEQKTIINDLLNSCFKENQKLFEINSMTILFSYATTKELSEFKADLIKYENLLRKNKNIKLSNEINNLVKMASIILLYKNTKYNFIGMTGEENPLLKIYPQEKIQKILKMFFANEAQLMNKNSRFNKKLAATSYENFYLQSDNKSFVYRKQFLDLLDLMDNDKNLMFLCDKMIKVDEYVLKQKMIKSLTTKEHNEFNKLKKDYFENSVEYSEKLFNLEKRSIEEQQQLRIINLNYHLDVFKLYNEINSRLIGLMRNRERDMYFATLGLIDTENKVQIRKKKYAITQIKKIQENINQLEQEIINNNEKVNSLLKEIFILDQGKRKLRSSIAHLSLNREQNKNVEEVMMNNQNGTIKKIKNMFKYDVKKEKSIEGIIEEIFFKYNYLVTFNNGILSQRDTDIKVKYIKRGKGKNEERKINLVNLKEQENTIEVFNSLKSYYINK